jgi:TPR repeat protein
MPFKRFLLLGAFSMRAAFAGDDPELARLYEENHKQCSNRLGGDTRAQYNLGLMLCAGEGTQKDLRGAVYWLQKSAAQNRREKDLTDAITSAINLWLAEQAKLHSGSDPAGLRGYQWKSLFLPEGTVLRSWSYGEHNYAQRPGTRLEFARAA